MLANCCFLLARSLPLHPVSLNHTASVILAVVFTLQINRWLTLLMHPRRPEIGLLWKYHIAQIHVPGNRTFIFFCCMLISRFSSYLKTWFLKPAFSFFLMTTTYYSWFLRFAYIQLSTDFLFNMHLEMGISKSKALVHLAMSLHMITLSYQLSLQTHTHTPHSWCDFSQTTWHLRGKV